MSDQAEEYELLANTQEGFRRQKNTIRQSLRLFTALEDSHIFKKVIHVLYVDFENAFGSVDHERLIEVLSLLHTLPQYLHSKQITDRRMVRRPDIVLIFRVRGDEKLPAVFVPLRKGDDRRILILEISYTALGLMGARTEDKRKKYEDTLKGLREDGWEPELYTLVLGTLGEIPSTAVQVFEEMGVRGIELDKLIEDIHMIAVGKAGECIQEEISRHEELSGVSMGGLCGMNKRKVVDQPKKRHNAKARRKETTKKRKMRDQSETKPGKRKSKFLFQKHTTNKRKERDQSAERTTRKKTKTLGWIALLNTLRSGYGVVSLVSSPGRKAQPIAGSGRGPGWFTLGHSPALGEELHPLALGAFPPADDEHEDIQELRRGPQGVHLACVGDHRLRQHQRAVRGCRLHPSTVATNMLNKDVG
eukprot:1824443-Pyramimonas_sp.AAC.1